MYVTSIQVASWWHVNDHPISGEGPSNIKELTVLMPIVNQPNALNVVSQGSEIATHMV